MLAALLERYNTILLPYGGNCRYDLVADTPDGLKRVQCKNGRYRNGVVTFSTCSSTKHWKNGEIRSYYGEADYFGVYCPELRSVYLVPVNHCPGSNASLRVTSTKNNQIQGIRMAAEYLIESPYPVLTRD